MDVLFTFKTILGVYIAEIAHPDSRKALLSITALSMNLGMSLPWIFGSFLTWRIIAVVASVPCFLVAIVTFFLPESPYYLIDQGQDEQAIKALKYYRNKTYDVSPEISEIQAKSIEKKLKKESFCRKCLLVFTPSFYKPFLCIGVLYSLDMLTGLWPASVYMQEIFEDSGMTYNLNYCITSIGIIRMITTMITPLFVQKLDTKLSYVIGAALKATATLTIALYFHYFQNVQELAITPFVMLLFVGSFLQPILITPVLYALMGELFPTEIRTFSVGIVESTYYFCTAIVIKYFPQMKLAMGLYGVFYFYAAFGALNAIWGYLTIPDNRSKTLTEIEEAFERKKENSETIMKDVSLSLLRRDSCQSSRGN